MVNMKNGFSLFELMIVVAILSILVVLAYPSYAESVMKGRRADAQSQLREFEVFAARRYTIDNNYSCFADGGACDIPASDDYYTYSITLGGNPPRTWSISAAPKGAQEKDACGTMTLNSAGQMTGKIAGCWGGKGTS